MVSYQRTLNHTHVSILIKHMMFVNHFMLFLTIGQDMKYNNWTLQDMLAKNCL